MYEQIILIAVACVAIVNSQIIGFGPCPAVTVKQNLDLSRYAGKWYEAEKYPNNFQANGKCVTATYTPNGNRVIVVNRQLVIGTDAPKNITGTARFAQDTNTEGKLLVNFPSVNILGWSWDSPYWVLDTDYTFYSVVYSCTDFIFVNFKFVWILTRPRFYVDLNAAYSILDAKKIDRTPLLKTDQWNCPLTH